MRYLTVPRTLCFILHGDDVLLIQRAPHKRIFPGKVNGVGGHVEAGEDVAASAAREILEETGLAVDGPVAGRRGPRGRPAGPGRAAARWHAYRA